MRALEVSPFHGIALIEIDIYLLTIFTYLQFYFSNRPTFRTAQFTKRNLTIFYRYIPTRLE